MGFGVQGLRFRVWGVSGFGLGSRVGFRVWGLGFGVSGFGVLGRAGGGGGG